VAQMAAKGPFRQPPPRPRLPRALGGHRTAGSAV